MTKLPHENWDVRGTQGPKYKVGPYCAVPQCGRMADHAHHLWRRSFLAGDYQWVRLWDDRVVQNLCALCFTHHEDITVGKAEIEFHDGSFYYILHNLTSEATSYARLVPQPQFLDAFEGALQLTIDGKEVLHSQVVAEPETPPCPTCGHKPKKAYPKRERRNRKRWVVMVPDDAEDGAEILDGLVNGCAERLGEDDVPPYYVLTKVLYDWSIS